MPSKKKPVAKKQTQKKGNVIRTRSPQKTPVKRVLPYFLSVVFLTAGILLILNRDYFRPQAATTSGHYKDYNVLLITIDTLRADHLPLYGYEKVNTPAIDQLGEGSFIFEDAIAHVPLTLPSHGSLLTGLLPMGHAMHDNTGYLLDDKVTTLAESLKSHGYKTAAFVSSIVLDSKWKIDQGFDHYYDDFDFPDGEDSASPPDVQRRAEQTELKAAQWLEQNKDHKFFLWVHYYDPHDPYDPPEPFKSLYAGRLYDGEIAYSDECTGRLLNRLQELKLKDRTLIILTGDHGEGLGEHGENDHGMFIYNATLQVPLLIRLPEGKKQRIQETVQHVDLSPTILDWLGIPPHPQIHGKSLVPLLQRKENQERAVYSESNYAELHFGWSPLQSITTAQYKYIEAPRPELYIRTKDHAETRNLIDQNPSIAKALRDRLQEMRQTYSRKDSAVPQEVDPEMEEKLRALGYIGTTAEATPETRKKDPKDRLHLAVAFDEALEALKKNQNDLVVRLITPVIQEEPQIVEAHSIAGVAYTRTKQYDKAIQQLEKVLEFDPGSVRALYNLGFAYHAAGKFEDAEKCYQLVLKQDPDYVRALSSLVQVYQQKNEREKAAPYFLRIAEIFERSLPRTVETAARATLFVKIAQAYTGANELDRAEENLKHAISLAPRKPVLHYELGSIYLLKNDVQAALQEFQKETTVAPRNFNAFKKMGMIYRNLNRLPEAIQCFERALQIRPQDPVLSRLMAETIRMANN